MSRMWNAFFTVKPHRICTSRVLYFIIAYQSDPCKRYFLFYQLVFRAVHCGYGGVKLGWVSPSIYHVNAMRDLCTLPRKSLIY